MNKPFVKNLMLGLTLDEFVGGLLHHVLYETSDYATCGVSIKDSDLLAIPRIKQWWERFIRILVEARDPKISFARSHDSLSVFSPKLDLPPIGYDRGDSRMTLSDYWRYSLGDIVKLNRFVKDFYGS